MYFDNGATTLKTKCLVDAANEYYEKYSANAHRGDYDISLKVDMAYEGERESVAKFLMKKLMRLFSQVDLLRN